MDTLRLPLTGFVFICSCADSQLWRKHSSVFPQQPLPLAHLTDVCSATLLINSPVPWNAAVPTEDQAGNIFISCRLTGSTVEQKTSSGMKQTREQIIPSPWMTCSSEPESALALLTSLKALWATFRSRNGVEACVPRSSSTDTTGRKSL